MKTLTELFAERNRLTIAEQKDFIRFRLPRWLSDNTRLRFWRFGDLITKLPHRVLLGIATWSSYDLTLIDALAAAVSVAHADDEQIDVFDLDEIVDVNPSPSMLHFEKYVPGIGRVTGSPVVGIWKNGVLVQKAKGAEGRAILKARYNL